MHRIYSVGVDLGGTWIRLEGLDARKHRVRSLKAAAPTVQHLPSFLRRTFRTWNVKPRYLSVGSRGIWTPHERKRMKRALRGLASHITVVSDVEAAWLAAFGPKGAGIIVIAGTGSIAYGRDPRGRSKRAGGLGPQIGDEGSAFWIGKSWLKKSPVKMSHRVVRRIAALAPKVLLQARRGNRLAKDIVREAQDHLALLAVSSAHRLRFKKKIPVSWGGSVLKNPEFRAGFLRALSKKSGRFQPVRSRQEGAPAMARLFS